MIEEDQIVDAVLTHVEDGVVWSLVGGPLVPVSFEFQSAFEAQCPWDFVHVWTDIPSGIIVYQITNTRPMDRW